MNWKDHEIESTGDSPIAIQQSRIRELEARVTLLEGLLHEVTDTFRTLSSEQPLATNIENALYPEGR